MFQLLFDDFESFRINFFCFYNYGHVGSNVPLVTGYKNEQLRICQKFGKNG